MTSYRVSETVGSARISMLLVRQVSITRVTLKDVRNTAAFGECLDRTSDDAGTSGSMAAAAPKALEVASPTSGVS